VNIIFLSESAKRNTWSTSLREKKKCQDQKLRKAAEMEKSKAVRTLNSLIEKKILKKTGAGRGVRYTLK